MSAWTTERPTKAGLFWYRPTSNHEPMIVKTFESVFYPGRVYAQACGGGPIATTLIINWGGEWQPVTLPAE